MAAARQPTATEVADTDAVIYRKLTFESAGNDDARILKMAKAFGNWCSMDDKRSITTTYKSMVLNLDRMKFDATRTRESVHTMEKVKSEYLTMKEKVLEEIEMTKKYIQKELQLKEELKNKTADRIQYQHLMTLVLSKPDRKAVQFKVDKLTEELAEKQRRLETVQEMMKKRREAMASLMLIAKDLAISLKEHDEHEFAKIKMSDDVLMDWESITPTVDFNGLQLQSDLPTILVDVPDTSAVNLSQDFSDVGVSPGLAGALLEDIQSDEEVPYVLQIKESESDGLYDNIIETLVAVKADD